MMNIISSSQAKITEYSGEFPQGKNRKQRELTDTVPGLHIIEGADNHGNSLVTK